MTQGRRTTTADIARAAGVSRATVSYVLNDTSNSGIPPHTAERIKKIAQELNYVPSAAARTLRSGSSNLVLGILPSWDLGPTYPQIFSCMGEALRELGYGFVLHSHDADNMQIESLLKFVAPCMVVTLQALPAAQKKVLKSAGIPHVLIDLAEFVALAGTTQIDFLYAQGRTRMLYVLPDHYLPDALVSPRIAAMQEQLNTLGLPPLQVVRLPYTAAGIDTLQRELIQGEPADYGICAHTDEVASFIYTMLGIDRFGPGKLGLMGVGNRPISNIGLTTVRLDVEYWADIWVAPLLRNLGQDVAPEPGEEQAVMAVEARRSA